jgi:methionyl-tRNA synthetase
MTTVVKCRECGGLFPFLPRGVCVDCLDQIERDYQTVRSYLRDNPGARVFQVAEATEVEEGRIQQFIADGRIELATSGSGDLTCEVCGTTIAGGRHCEPCRRRLVAGLNQTLETTTPVNRLGMHSRDR